MDLVQFRPKRELDAEDAIAVLEQVLAEAREGRIQCVAIGYGRPDGCIGTYISEGPAGPLMAAAGLLFHRVMQDD